MLSLWKTEEKFTPGSNIASLKAQESRGENLDGLDVHTRAQGCTGCAHSCTGLQQIPTSAPRLFLLKRCYFQ